MKYLALDLGEKHLGAAISLEGRIASPLIEVNCVNYKNLIDSIFHLVDQHRPEYLIVGQPDQGPIIALGQLVKQSLLKERPTLIVIFQPEDFTSEIAKRKLFELQATKNKRQQTTHATSAAVILQEYLDENPV